MITSEPQRSGWFGTPLILLSSPDPAIDANLAIALDALPAENSVTRAAARLHPSPAAMSRTLARLRRILQDPLLVRAGRAMVPTPRAQALREEAAAVVRSLGALLSAGASVDPAGLRSTFTLQAADLVGAAPAPGLLQLAQQEVPGVCFRVRAEELEAGPALRDGRIDLEVGSIDHVDPETQVEELVSLRMVAAVRPGHPLTEGPLPPVRLAAPHTSRSAGAAGSPAPSTPPLPSRTSSGGSAWSFPAIWPR
ncbi:DNA-binding transcriptional LysR family regulator [Streptomyces canus]|nr:DNA-binding transcriptional LysR family regulator [Streptomyces canus]